MVELYARDGWYQAYAIGTADLTQWDNAQAALVVGELNAMDWFIGAEITNTKPRTERLNPMTSTHIPKRLQVGRILGAYASTHFLQTGILQYVVMGACTTTEATPNIHAITKTTGQDPIRYAPHFEKEVTTNHRRRDLMGHVPISLDVYCSEKVPIATQTITTQFAFTGVGGDLAQPTALTQAAHAPYKWYDYKHASGASSFLYNTGAIGVDIVEIHEHIGWSGALFGTYDSNGYPTAGKLVPPFDSYVEIGFRFTDTGTDIRAISDLAHGSYAGDLDIIIDFYESATRYRKNTWDKMYVAPESFKEIYKTEGSWYDGATVKLEFLDENSSCVCEEKNALNNDYYENP